MREGFEFKRGTKSTQRKRQQRQNSIAVIHTHNKTHKEEHTHTQDKHRQEGRTSVNCLRRRKKAKVVKGCLATRLHTSMHKLGTGAAAAYCIEATRGEGRGLEQHTEKREKIAKQQKGQKWEKRERGGELFKKKPQRQAPFYVCHEYGCASRTAIFERESKRGRRK